MYNNNNLWVVWRLLYIGIGFFWKLSFIFNIFYVPLILQESTARRTVLVPVAGHLPTNIRHNNHAHSRLQWFCLLNVGEKKQLEIHRRVNLVTNESNVPDTTHNLPHWRICLSWTSAYVGHLPLPAIRWCAFVHTMESNPLEHEHPSRIIKERVNDCHSNLFHKWEKSESTLPSIPSFSKSGNKQTWLECQQLALEVAQGEMVCYSHNGCNYANYYHKKMQELRQWNTTYLMLTVRTEHLAEDWDNLEKAFGGNGRTNGSVRFEQTKAHVVAREGNSTFFCLVRRDSDLQET
jgi:hypothetical protein